MTCDHDWQDFTECCLKCGKNMWESEEKKEPQPETPWNEDGW